MSSSSSSSSASTPPPTTPPGLHQNTINPEAPWLVQKFGGTSIGKFAIDIARDIIPNYIDQYQVAVVCSARSGSTKALGTTNLLLRAASQVRQRQACKSASGTQTPISNGLFRRSGSRSDSPSFGLAITPITASSTKESNRGSSNTPPAPEFAATVDLIRSEHLAAARANVKDPDLLQELEDEIDRDCDWLNSYLLATQLINEISLRSRDNIVGFGERLACKLMTAILRDQGVDAEYVSLEDIVPISDIDAFDPVTFYDGVSHAVAQRIRECAPRVPVVTGFFGPVPGSLLRQIGRGYTDLLSSLLAAGLDACELQIWKEVDGIFTADPRKVPTARLLPVISPDEAAELTYYGSEVVHPFTMEQVLRKNIPIRIKNVENPSGHGTVIQPEPDGVEDLTAKPINLTSLPSFSSLSSASSPCISSAFQTYPYYGSRRLPSAVTIKDHIIILNVNSNRTRVSHGFLAKIFGVLDSFGVVVDLVSTSEVHISMAIEDISEGACGGADTTENGATGCGKKVLDKVVAELGKCGTVTVHPQMCILSLVGKHMHNMIGIAGRMFTTLAQGSVNIEMISQGASEINISCVIQARDAVKALNLIHQSCLGIGVNGVGAEVGGGGLGVLTGVGTGGVRGIDGKGGRVGPWLF
ncbi:Aspartate/glutamate/uridylate kinase [Pisolithus orientalis]|uniref:Aspartate/glutamate/uridylate kinase n=1 Tax=Pisolithus orientalis TaxID=936130 RepID=UPI0022250A81|nr:Aspartate/glutamate/uridylate kinase [Pisolithus orientalis]KAI6001590.1 Aspartate/glutamate/uridylate kinase [Pisolithus orientalis]